VGARGRAALVGLVAGVALAVAALPPSAASAAADADPALSSSALIVLVTGTEASTYPAFDPTVSRYAITTTEETAGTIEVAVATEDPAAVVSVDGAPAPGGRRTVSGLSPGDEVAVFVDDAAGRAAYSFVYLPPGFPSLERVGASDEPTPGHVLLTLGLWTKPSPFFETAVDANGVPAHVQQTTSSSDLKQIAGGHYTVSRGDLGATGAGATIVELDEQWREVARSRTVGLTNTDNHDSVSLPDGSHYLLAYEPNPATGLIDAVVQHVSARGQVLFTWSSADHVDPAAETVYGDRPDYAHVNSIQVMRDGDLLLSFRHLSSVFKVARTAHDGHRAGDVVWRLGGRRSDFAFTGLDGARDGGPCAQHTATELPDGDIEMFDNGAWSLGPLCVDPTDPDGPPVARVPTRVVRWRLDAAVGTATAVRDHRVGGRYAIFAGSAQPLPGDGTLVGWASSTDAVVSELAPDGSLLWELRDPAAAGERYFTYRAQKAVVPDATPPVAAVSTPAAGATYRQGESVTPAYRCTDRGGSSLSDCVLGSVDTRRPGTHTLTLTATDGAGNRTVVRRDYEVLAPARADAAVRPRDAGVYAGGGAYGSRPRQQARLAVPGRATRVAVVRVRNTGDVPGRFRLSSSTSGRGFAVRVAMAGGGRTSPVVEPGSSWTGRVEVSARAGVRPADRVVARLDVAPVGEPARGDTVWVLARR